MPSSPPQRQSARVSLSPASLLSSTPRAERVIQCRQANQAAETILESEIEAFMTVTTNTMATATTAPVVEPPCSHERNIVETTKVGIALRDQAQKQLTLDTKFDAQTNNTKALLREPKPRAME